MKALVLAAGRAVRLGEMAEHTPKPMVRLAGRSVLEHNLRWLARHGVRDIAINLHHLGHVIEQHVGDGAAFGVRVRYSRELELRGTAGALAPLRELLAGGPFLVVYGGSFLDFDLAALWSAHASTAAVATLALLDPRSDPSTGAAGSRVEMDRSGRVLRLVKGREDLGLRWVWTGCAVLEPSLLQHVPDDRRFDFGRDLFPLVLRHGGILGGHCIDGCCLEIDTPDALRRARRLLGEMV